jgi:hypothetical protein
MGVHISPWSRMEAIVTAPASLAAAMANMFG